MIINSLELLQNPIINRYYYHPAWIVMLTVLSVMLVGYSFSAFRSRVISLIKAFFSLRFGEQFSREDRSLSHPVSIFLSLNFLLIFSLFILFTVAFFHNSIQHPSFLIYLIIFSAILAIYSTKIMTIKIVGFLFDKSIIASEYISLIYLVNQVTGIAFIPITIFVAYAKPGLANIFVYIGIFMFGLALIVRGVKGIIIAVSSGWVNPFYLLLYLCTLEILPWLFAWKLFEKS